MVRIVELGIVVCLLAIGSLNLLSNPFLVGRAWGDYPECSEPAPGEACTCYEGVWICCPEERDDDG
jgi:hypothetical protein